MLCDGIGAYVAAGERGWVQIAEHAYFWQVKRWEQMQQRLGTPRNGPGHAPGYPRARHAMVLAPLQGAQRMMQFIILVCLEFHIVRLCRIRRPFWSSLAAVLAKRLADVFEA